MSQTALQGAVPFVQRLCTAWTLMTRPVLVTSARTLKLCFELPLRQLAAVGNER
jgi:hypothetical protein